MRWLDYFLLNNRRRREISWVAGLRVSEFQWQAW